MPGRGSKTRWVVALLAGVWVAACSCGGGGGGGGGGVGPIDNPEELRVGTIPPGGGTLASSDGEASVSIPSGALPAATQLEVDRLRQNEVPALITQLDPIRNVWRFGPRGQQFLKPVEISLEFDTQDLPPGVPVSRLTLVTIGLDGRLETLQQVRVTGASTPGGLRAAVRNRLNGLISHFSEFAIVIVPQLVFTAPPQLEGRVGQAFSYSFCKPELTGSTVCLGGATNPTGGQPPYHFQLGTGVGFPPVGLSLGSNGILSGTPSSTGTSTFSVCAVDLAGQSVCRTVTMMVASPPATIAGTWRAIIMFDEGVETITFSLAVSGTAVTGSGIDKIEITTPDPFTLSISFIVSGSFIPPDFFLTVTTSDGDSFLFTGKLTDSGTMSGVIDDPDDQNPGFPITFLRQ